MITTPDTPTPTPALPFRRLAAVYFAGRTRIMEIQTDGSGDLGRLLSYPRGAEPKVGDHTRWMPRREAVALYQKSCSLIEAIEGTLS